MKLQDLKDDITTVETTIKEAIQHFHKKWGIDVEVKAECKDGVDGEIMAINVISGIVFSNK